VEAVLTIFLASLLVFAMVAALPGDPALIILGDRATPDQLQALRSYLGLDQPVGKQYARWMGRIVRGDLGHSLINGIRLGPGRRPGDCLSGWGLGSHSPSVAFGHGAGLVSCLGPCRPGVLARRRPLVVLRGRVEVDAAVRLCPIAAKP